MLLPFSTNQAVASPSRQSGFTLVELLAVIAIVATLSAILIPVVGHVRESAQASECAGNLRQLGSAFLLYTSDHTGALPTEHSTDEEKDAGNEWYYPNKLASYAPPERWAIERHGNMRGGVWQCPSLDDDELSWGAGYGTNRSHVVLPMGDPVYLSQVTRPAEIVLIGDVWSRSRQASWISMVCPECSNWGRSTEANPLHGGKANMCFVDGHVEAIDYDDLADNKNDMFGHRHL